jgi:hypothetical protein
MPSITAPVSCARSQPYCSESGFSTTPKRKRAPEAIVMVMAITATMTQP